MSSTFTGKNVPGADMQRYTVQRDAGGLHGGEKLRREMQPRRRRGDSAGLAREQRLIVVGVAHIRRALAGDIGRQRHRALLRDGRVERGAGKIEGERDFAAFALGLDAGRERAELDALADAQLLGRPRQRAPM